MVIKQREWRRALGNVLGEETTSYLSQFGGGKNYFSGYSLHLEVRRGKKERKCFY